MGTWKDKLQLHPLARRWTWATDGETDSHVVYMATNMCGKYLYRHSHFLTIDIDDLGRPPFKLVQASKAALAGLLWTRQTWRNRDGSKPTTTRVGGKLGATGKRLENVVMMSRASIIRNNGAGE